MKEKAKRTFGKKHLVAVLVAVMVFACIFVVSALANTAPSIDSVSLTVGESVNMNFTVNAAEDANPTMKFTYNGVDGVVEYTAEPVSQDGETYVFTFAGITPQNFEEKVTGELIIDGSVVATAAYSVEDYCAWALEQDGLKNIATALLNYGAAAEWYVGEIDDPGLTGLPTKDQMSVVAEKGLDTADGTETATMNRVGLILSNVISTYFDFTTDFANPSFRVTVDGKARDAKITNNGDGTYRAVIDMKATEIFGKIVASVTDSEGNDISRTATYSVTAYLYKQADNADARLATLVKTIYRYGFYAHDLGAHALMPVKKVANDTIGLRCALCGEVYQMSNLKYIEDYTSGTGTVKATGAPTLTNEDGALKVVIGSGATDHGTLPFDTKNYTTNPKSILVGFDAKSAAGRHDDFYLMFRSKVDGKNWTHSPKSNPVTIAADGTLKFFDTEVGTVSTDKFTSILVNLTIVQDITNANDVAKYVLDAWVDGQYVGQFTNDAKAKTGTINLDMTDTANPQQIQLSTRRTTAGMYNEMYLDNVILASGIDMSGKNVDEIATLTHDYVQSTVDATCTEDGSVITACKSCGTSTSSEAIPAKGHTEISHAVNAGVITYTCEVCEAAWSSTSLLLADGTATSMLEGNTSNLDFVGGTNFPNVVDGHYEFVKTATTEVASHGQFRLVRTTAGTAPSGASVVANRLGFVSISLQAVDSPVDKNPNHNYSWALQLANNASGSEWGTKKGKSKGFPILTGVVDDGSKAETLGGVVIDLAENGFTRIDISFVSVENDMYLLTYYVDGTLVDTIVVDNILFNYTPHCLYFDCYATKENQSFVFDDLTLAFADAASADFFPWNHVHEAGTEAEMIDDDTHRVKCEGCDVFVGTAEHEYDFAGSTCAGGVATGECVCGATTTKTIEHTLVAQGVASNVVTYECAVCEAVYTMNVGFGSDMSGNVGFTIQDIVDAGVADGVFTQSAIQDAPQGRENGYIAVYTQGKITSTTTMLLGFDIKNTENRAGYFTVQWRTPCTVNGKNNNWAFSGDDTKLEIKPDGSIYFANVTTDTGFDISETEFTSILMKATLVVDGTSTTLYVDLWVNGQYAGTATKKSATTDASWLKSGSGAQICVENNKGTNEVILDNLFVADVPAGAEGIALVNYLTAAE